MPWEHCGQRIMDDRPCPSCNVTKQVWTTQFQSTRVFQLSTSWDGDPDAQADALRRAARNGTPFCEKCRLAHPQQPGGATEQPAAAGAGDGGA